MVGSGDKYLQICNLTEIFAPKLEIVTHLTFWIDNVMQHMNERLKTAASQTYFAAVPVTKFETTYIPVP